jgi:Fuc2NAc and GlcNAc transferase
MELVYAFIFSSVASFALCFPARWLLERWKVVDRPNERSSHSRLIVRGGGAAIVLVLLVIVGSIGLTHKQSALLGTLLIATTLLAVISFVDDLRSLPSWFRFTCHGLAAAAALVAFSRSGAPFVLGENSFGEGLSLLALGLAFLWIVGYTNAFNFMDGINGLAAGQAVVTGFGMALLGGLTLRDYADIPMLWSIAIAGVAFGFIPHNFPQARIFMGDVGSIPLGFCLAVLALWLVMEAGVWLLIPLLLLHANFVLDTGITLLRRIRSGERWQEAHREHFYQRLIRSHKSHAFVTVLEMSLQCVVLGLMVLYLHASIPMRMVLVALVILIWLAFFIFCEHSFCRNTLLPVGAQQHDGK